jgi:hypothetical protein
LIDRSSERLGIFWTLSLSLPRGLALIPPNPPTFLFSSMRSKMTAAFVVYPGTNPTDKSTGLMCAEIITGGSGYRGARMQTGKSPTGFSVPTIFLVLNPLPCTKKRYIRQNVKFTLHIEMHNMPKGLEGPW